MIENDLTNVEKAAGRLFACMALLSALAQVSKLLFLLPDSVSFRMLAPAFYFCAATSMAILSTRVPKTREGLRALSSTACELVSAAAMMAAISTPQLRMLAFAFAMGFGILGAYRAWLLSRHDWPNSHSGRAGGWPT